MADLARRSLLAAFSALPAATVAAALPTPVLAHPAADQDIATLARRIARWAALDAEACARFADADDARPKDQRHVDRAMRLARWTSDRVERAGAALTLMQPRTLAGTMAKAEAFHAIQASGWEHCAAAWRDDLAASIVADVLRVGGQTNG